MDPGQQRAFDQRFEEIEDPSTSDPVVGDDVFRGVGVKAAGEDPDPLEHHALVVVEEVVAPVKRRSQGLLASGRGSSAPRQDRQLIVESVRELRR